MKKYPRKLLCLSLCFLLSFCSSISVYAEEIEMNNEESVQEEVNEEDNTGEESFIIEEQEEADPEEPAEDEELPEESTEPADSENETSEEASEELLQESEDIKIDTEIQNTEPEEENEPDNPSETSEDPEDDTEPEEEPEQEENASVPSIFYEVHLSNIGWTNSYADGETTQEGRFEAIKIHSEELDGDIVYQSHVQNIGWMTEINGGRVSGTTGQSKQIEAIRISLTGNAAELYDIAYRVKIRDFGWTGWALNGMDCGSEGYSLPIMSIEIKFVNKGDTASDPSTCFYKKSEMKIQAHVQNKGWLKAVNNGNIAGTTGQSLRMEALRITLPEDLLKLGDIQAFAHVQNIGWMAPVGNDGIIGTTGRSKALEAVRISLTGELGQLYDICYRVHVHNIGWLGYAYNGEEAGTVGYGLAIEAVEILLEKKGGLANAITGSSAYLPSYEYQKIQYQAHVANEGWNKQVSAPTTAGDVGKKRPIEALIVSLPEHLAALGNVNVTVHVQNKGWLDTVNADTVAGTTGEALRMEGVRITLSGELADKYDIYYRTYVQGFGWLGWAKNGGLAGSEGCSRWIEGIQIDLVDKVYKKYTAKNSYTTLKLGGNTSTLISILKGNLGTNISGFGGYSTPASLKNSLLNEVRSIQNSGYSVGFVMIDLGTGKGVSYSADQKMYSASSVKGLYIGALLSQNRAAYNNDRANIQAILRTSDNALYSALGNKYGFSYIRNWCNSTGIDSNVCANLYTYYSARDMAKLWVKMDEFFSSGSYGTEIGTWYQNPNRSPIHSQLGGRYITRSKAGWIAESGYSAAVDGGIVYSTKGAYVITVISNMPASLDRLNGIVNLLEAVHNNMVN